ncbi:hypothetical protein RFI_08369, partial [Reticulomyxa filosa]
KKKKKIKFTKQMAKQYSRGIAEINLSTASTLQLKTRNKQHIYMYMYPKKKKKKSKHGKRVQIKEIQEKKKGEGERVKQNFETAIERSGERLCQGRIKETHLGNGMRRQGRQFFFKQPNEDIEAAFQSGVRHDVVAYNVE